MSVVGAFKGQPFSDAATYQRDIGRIRMDKADKDIYAHTVYSQVSLIEAASGAAGLELKEEDDVTGYRNAAIVLPDTVLLDNIREIQQQNNIRRSGQIAGNLGRCSLDVEMETGTGKTYVYIKTMYELNRQYGWSKFIVVVPSVAIREGVKKTFEMTQEHFQEQYEKKVRYFVYNSNNLNQLDEFSSNTGICVMIINMQAFNSSMKEGGRSKEARVIYEERDTFGARRPIDVIRANNPILILDEPQKMGGDATQKALQNFNPLFCLHYSATHREHHNLVYALDAVDAYNQRLVKRIEVKGFQVKNLKGTDKYLYLENILVSPAHLPKARLELEIRRQKSINREMRIVSVDDNLYEISKHMEQYKDYRVAGIDPAAGSVSFTNGEVIYKGDIVGDISEKDMRRIQIRETIISHLEKEEELFYRGIKTLSLFFIDEVSKYRVYGENGEEQMGEYGRIFEEEYQDVVAQYRTKDKTPYQKYLQAITPQSTHKGYFSIDKKGRSINSDVKGNANLSDDICAYDLILKNKERLLSFEEPVRFLFSHSALREGWDNPNVFQICTLKHSDSATAKRQEVGRGLRLCVNQEGFRMDEASLGRELVHKVNRLTVIASEGYQSFAADLQNKIKESLYERPKKAAKEYFIGQTVCVDGVAWKLSSKQAFAIYRYLIKNDYIDEQEQITQEYHEDLKNHTVAPLPEELQPVAEGIHRLLQSIFDEAIIKEMIDNGNQTPIQDNALNENFATKEFRALWEQINHKYAYTTSFDSNELIARAIVQIDQQLFVSSLQYTVTRAEQKDAMDTEMVKKNDSFGGVESATVTLQHLPTGQIPYDLVGKIAEGATLTRKTAAAILQGISPEKFAMFQHNPEEFLGKAIRLIKEQKAILIVENISYEQIAGKYDDSIFTEQKRTSFHKAFRAKKHIQDYVFTDGIAENSIECRFAKELDSAEEVCAYAKLPRRYSIPTPVGNYSPDWAIAFYEGSVKHIYFLAETKGTMESLALRPVEQAKIACARKLFNEISTEDVVYHDVDCYQSLLDVMDHIGKASSNCAFARQSHKG